MWALEILTQRIQGFVWRTWPMLTSENLATKRFWASAETDLVYNEYFALFRYIRELLKHILRHCSKTISSN